MSLTTAAATMVLSLGYNRISNLRNDVEEERDYKIFLFWMTYIFDTSFSVRLGRSPFIQDYDITVPVSTYRAAPEGLSDAFRYWIENGRLLCKAVQQLYSSAAVRRSRDERARNARDIILSLERAWEIRDKVIDSYSCFSLSIFPSSDFFAQVAFASSQNGDHGATFRQLIKQSDSIMHFSVL
jgi:hypothetical protein